MYYVEKLVRIHVLLRTGADTDVVENSSAVGGHDSNSRLLRNAPKEHRVYDPNTILRSGANKEVSVASPHETLLENRNREVGFVPVAHDYIEGDNDNIPMADVVCAEPISGPHAQDAQIYRPPKPPLSAAEVVNIWKR